MFSCFSSKSIPIEENLPPKPPKPGGSKSTLPAKPGMEVVASDPPVAPPKPKALQGRSTLVKDKKENFRSEEDKKEILAMTGPSKGPSCITVSSAREEVSKDGTEKYYAYKIVVKLAGGKTHTAKFRYSEFAAFHKDWQKDYPGVMIEMPKKQLQMSDEDIARRCVELQMYLRELCEVSALIYPVSKFLGVDETELKAAIKGKTITGDAPSSGGSSTPSRQSKNLGRQLPKVRLDDLSDDKRASVGDKPKLPKVKLNDIDNFSVTQDSPPPPVPPKANDDSKRQSTPPPPTPKQEIPISTPTSNNRLSTQQSAPTISPKQPSSPSVPAIPPSRSQQSATLAKTQSEPVKATQAGQKTSPAMNGAGTGLSVKERMAAFQKKN